MSMSSSHDTRVNDMAAIRPVSYTHLDVYKRQPYSLVKYSDTITLSSGTIPVIAVMMNLDVYKRQTF